MCPRLLREAVLGLPSVSGLNGRSAVSSAKSDRVCWRDAGFVGLICLIPMSVSLSYVVLSARRVALVVWPGLPRELDSLEELDLRALGEPDVGLLPVRAAPQPAALAARLAVRPGDPHLFDLGLLELALHGALDVDLVRARVDLEGDDVVGLLHVHHLLGEQRPADDLLEPHRVSTSTSRPRAPSETTR